MKGQHRYSLTVTWTGNTGKGTVGYTAYERSHSVKTHQKPELFLSSDPAFRGDQSRYNPEELLLASLSSCHMLWYLHVCAEAGVVVTAYEDKATGSMQETDDGGGRFTEVTLHPKVTVADSSMYAQAMSLHKKANSLCFIANSVNFPVNHAPEIL